MKSRMKFKELRKAFGGMYRAIAGTAILCMLVPLFVLTVYSVTTVNMSVHEIMNDNLQQLALDKMTITEAVIQNQIAFTKAVVDSPLIVTAVTESYKSGDLKTKEQTDIQNYLGGIFAASGNRYENFFITCGSMGYADCLNGETLHDVRGEPWYETCLTDGVFIGNNISPVTGRPVYVISFAIHDPLTGEVVGGINNSIDLAKMTENVTGNTLKEDNKVLIVDAEGNVIASENSEQILSMNFFELSDSTANAMNTMLSSSDNNGSIEFELDGVRNIGAFSAVDSMYTVVFTSADAYSSASDTIIFGISIVGAICFVLACCIITLICLNIVLPLRNIADNIACYGDADFTKEVPERYKKRKDEMGVLAKAMYKMHDMIHQVLTDVIKETDSVKVHIDNSNDRIIDLTSKVGTVNDITTNLAAEMQETAVSTELIEQNVKNIKDAITKMSNESEKGKEFSEDISARARELKQNAVQSQKRASELTTEISDGLKMAIEQSKAVNQIDELSGAILEIASQTNLLALNASIEAARAGEAGKGFSVVADEIRKLAENSQNTVSAIQEVTKQVVVAVSNLSENSRKTIDFIDATVIGDYQVMVDIGEQYYSDADSVKKLVDVINMSVNNLQEAIDSMSISISEISKANNEESISITNITHNTSEVLERSKQIEQIINSVEISMQKLKDTISIFKI